MNNIVLYLTLNYPTETRFFDTLDIVEYFRIPYIEIGIPTQTPVYEGKIIRKAHELVYNEALDTSYLVKVLTKIRDRYSFKVILMTYQDGFDQFYLNRLDSKLYDGILCVDQVHYPKTIKKPIYIYNPTLSLENIDKQLKHNVEFCYVQSYVGKTGSNFQITKKLLTLIEILKNRTHLPLMLGFGIKNKKHIEDAMELGLNGVIIGSEFMKNVLRGSDAVHKFLTCITDNR